ncbi:MAG TPA: hypothetical protein VMU40_11390 [Steroidobacteraceae bacterium]|nr:hypothetical protein [Steroidobacteraceae bacterium]
MTVRNKSSAPTSLGTIATLAGAFTLLATFAPAPARADCLLPPPPSKVPDGASASQQEMITAMQTLKQYDGDVSIYLKCLDYESRENRLAPTERDLKHDAAVNRLQQVVDKFNEQVRVFKSKHG